MTSALVVLSGGQDSTTCLYWAKARFDPVHAVTFDYQQRHRREIEAARTVAHMAGAASHEVVELGPILKGRSPLTNPNEQLEIYGSFDEMAKIIGDRVELTFVPMRNALFLTLAMNRALVLGCKRIVTGVCQEDNANYPDCRQGFIDAFFCMSTEALALDTPVIETPLMYLTKAQTVKLARELPGCWEALAYSHTSYDGSYPPTGKDHATTLRAQGFLDAGEPDPLVARAWREGLMPLPGTSNYDVLRESKKKGRAEALPAGSQV